MVQVWKFERIFEKKDRSVIADQVPVTFFRVELDSKTTDITFCISRATLSGYSREAGKQICCFPTSENIFARVYRVISLVYGTRVSISRIDR
jgi:hypothetical protein